MPLVHSEFAVSSCCACQLPSGKFVLAPALLFVCMPRALVPALMQALQEAGLQHVLVVVGGIIPPQDHEELFNLGVAAIYGPGTRIPAAALDMIQLLVGPEALGPGDADAGAGGSAGQAA